MKSKKSISIGGDAVSNVIATGDRNKIKARIETDIGKPDLPDPESVDMAKELAAIRVVLEQLSSEHAGKISRAIDDATEETQKTKPDKDEIGAALNRAIDYAKKSNGFADEAGKLAPHIAAAAAWLGSHWHQLAVLVGM